MGNIKIIFIKDIQKPFKTIDVKNYDKIYIEGYDFPLPSESSSDIKPAMDWESLVKQLQEHDVTINNSDKAKSFILKTNYYKISIFIRYLNNSHKNLDNLIDLYLFNRFVSENISKLVAPIELYLKSTFANYLSINVYKDLNGYDDNVTPSPLIYLNKKIYKRKTLPSGYSKMISNFAEIFHGKINKDLTVDHHIQKYGGNIPIWVLVEHITLGQFSTLITSIHRNIIKNWVEEYVSSSWQKAIAEWINTIRILRNTAAHNDRFYGRYFTYSPILPEEIIDDIEYDSESKYSKEFEKVKNTLFSGLLITKLFYQHFDEYETANWNEFLHELDKKIIENPNVHLDLMGFPENWKTLLIINKN